METLFVNLFAGPGTGKSTTAAAVFSRIKADGVNAELIQEYAKDKVWSQDLRTLKCQPYVTSKQLYRQYRLMGQVDVAITDSPILLGAMYGGFGCVEGWEEVLVKQFNLFNNLNVFLVRNAEAHPYNPKGRNQTEEEAVAVDMEIMKFLGRHSVPYDYVAIRSDGGQTREITQMIYERISVKA